MYEPSGIPTRCASVAGSVALVRIAVRFVQIPVDRTGPTSSGAISSRGVIGAAGDERDVSLVGAQREVDLLLHSSRHLLGAQLALLRLGHVGVDRPQSRLCLLDPTAGIDEHVLDGGGKWRASDADR